MRFCQIFCSSRVCQCSKQRGVWLFTNKWLLWTVFFLSQSNDSLNSLTSKDWISEWYSMIKTRYWVGQMSPSQDCKSCSRSPLLRHRHVPLSLWLCQAPPSLWLCQAPPSLWLCLYPQWLRLCCGLPDPGSVAWAFSSTLSPWLSFCSATPGSPPPVSPLFFPRVFSANPPPCLLPPSLNSTLGPHPGWSLDLHLAPPAPGYSLRLLHHGFSHYHLLPVSVFRLLHALLQSPHSPSSAVLIHWKSKVRGCCSFLSNLITVTYKVYIILHTVNNLNSSKININP